MMKSLKIIVCLVLVLIAFKGSTQTNETAIKDMVDAKRFIFSATSAMPTNSSEINQILGKMSPGSAGTITLSGSAYDVQVYPDSLAVHLPYYGRSYSANMSHDDGGFKFSTKEFSYKNTKRRKGGWDITIIPKDTKENPRLNLTIFTNGNATLNITSNNKQSISYNGVLTKPKS